MKKNEIVATVNPYEALGVVSRLSAENIGTEAKPQIVERYNRVIAEGSDGTTTTIIATGTTAYCINILDMSEQLDYLVAFKKCCALAYLDEVGVDTISSAFKSIGQLAERFGIKSDTAKGYARVGKHFLNFDTDTKEFSYKCPAIEGASVTNLVQMLSLVNPDAEEPLGEIINLVAEGRLHPWGTLSNLKKEMHDIRTTIGDGATADKGKGKGKDKGKDKDNKPTIADSFAVVYEAIEALEETDKAEALEAMNVLERILTK